MQVSDESAGGPAPVFDEDHLVVAGGLPAVLGLAEQADFTGLLGDSLTVDCPNAGLKARSLVAGMLAGADDIDGTDILRTGGTRTVLGGVRALAAGAHGFLLKDTPPARMIEMIRAVAAGSTPCRPPSWGR